MNPIELMGRMTALDLLLVLLWIAAVVFGWNSGILRQLRTNYVDALTFYYVEHPEEWRQIIGPGGALEYCSAARRGMQRPYDDLMDVRVPEFLYDFSSPHAYLAARGVTGVPTVAVGDDLLWETISWKPSRPEWRRNEQTQAWIARGLCSRARMHGDVGVLWLDRRG